MSEFYAMNPKLILRYQPFMQKRLEKIQEDAHFGGWVYGQYVAASIGANFSKRAKYPKKPYFVMESEEADEEEAYVMTDVERFKMFALSFNAEHRNLKRPVIDAEATEIETVDS